MSVLDGARLTVCIDFKNPHAYLANEPTWALLDELSIDAQWLPFAVAPLPKVPLPKGPLPKGPPVDGRDDRGTRHRRLRAAYIERDLERYARVRGLTLTDPYRNPDVTLAGVAMLALENAPRRAQRRFVTDVFDRYWRSELDIEDHAAIRAAVATAGGDVAAFEASAAAAGRERLARIAAELGELGMFSTPAFCIDGEIYYGRAHLPMIRWLLTERSGPPPL